MSSNFTSSPKETLTASLQPAASNPRDEYPRATLTATPLPRAAKQLLALLERIPRGGLRVTGPDGFERTFGQTLGGVDAQIHILDWRMCQETLRFGDIGFAESYFKQYWHTSNLTALLNFFLIYYTLISVVLQTASGYFI